LILSLVVTIILLAILISQLRLSEFTRIISGIPPGCILLGLFLYLGFNLFRALRFRCLLDYKLGLGDLFPIVLVHNMLNNILPARTGELTYLYMVKKRGIQSGESIASLLIARFFDMISLSVIFLIAVFFIGKAPSFVVNLLYIISLFMFLLVIFLAAVFYYGKGCIKILRRISNALDLKRFSFVRWMIKRVKEVVDSFQVIELRRKLPDVVFFSSGIWLLAFIFYMVLLEGMEINLSIFAVIIGAAFVIFASFLPIQGIAGFGTVEGAWTLAFMALGIPVEMAIASGFSFHIMRLFYSGVVGAVAYSVLKYRRRI